MLSQKHKHTSIPSNQLKTKGAKPFSLLSMGLSKLPRVQNKHPTCQINKQKHQNKQNSQINNDQNIQTNRPTKELCFKQLEINQKEPPYTHQNINSNNLLQLEENYETELNQDIVFTNQKISLQNISNLMMDQPDHQEKAFDKENCNVANFSLGYRQKQAHETIKEDRLVVNLKKKIKKLQKNIKTITKPLQFVRQSEINIEDNLSHIELSQQDALSLAHIQFLNNPLSDRQVYPESYIFRNQIITQRIDNDIDSDDEQIQKGIQRMHRFLSETLQQNNNYITHSLR